MRALNLGDALTAIGQLKRELINKGEATELFGQVRGEGLASAIATIEQGFGDDFFIQTSQSIDVYWLLSEADIPPGLKFEEDKTNPSHYFLTVTEKMLTSQLVTKLRLVSYRMSVIRDGSKVL
jgi:hypothetical protein